MPEIDVKIRRGVGTISLNAPARRNALTSAMAKMLIAACDELDGNPRVGAVVVRGEGGYFCAGAERSLLAAVQHDPAGAEEFAALTAIYRSFARVSELSVPSVAAVRGGAVGAGVNLLLSTSVRVVGADATINAGFTSLGLHPGGGHLALLSRLTGYDATVAIGVLGQKVSGARACQLGIAWLAVPDDDVEPRAENLVQLVAQDPELSRMVTESLAHEVGPPPMALSAAMQFERSAQMRTQRRLGERAERP